MKRAQEPRRAARKNNNKKRLFGATPVGLTVIALMAGLTAVFAIVLTAAQLLPSKLLLLIYLALLVVLAVIFFLARDHKKRTRFMAGLVVSAVMTLILVIGGFTLSRGIQALSSITGAKGETDYISVYVRQDDAAQEMSDTATYTYGILETMDRDLTDKVIKQINKELSAEIATEEYASIPALLDALFRGEVDAILLPDAYLELVEDLPGYGDANEKMRLLKTYEFKSITQVKKPKPGSVFTVLISGIDSRYGLLAKSRSDVNILATINTETRQVLLVSTPRDFFVPLSISNGIPDKLTHAGVYGVDVCMDTIGMIYDLDIDYFFRVNFEGFKEIIDSLGGVTVESEYEFSAKGYYFTKGENYLTGDAALAFARERYSFKDGDRQRGRNQMAVIRAVINKALSPELLKNFSSVLTAVEGNFETSVPYNKIAEIVRQQLNEGGDWNIVTYSANGTADTQYTYSMSIPLYVLIPDQSTVDTAKELMRQVRDGEIIKKP